MIDPHKTPRVFTDNLFGTIAFGLVPLALVALVGCGRQATEADCAVVVDQNVEVQMKSMHITDEAAIAKRKAEIRAQMKDVLQGCVGKRVTDGMLTCVKKAETAEEIDRCMR